MKPDTNPAPTLGASQAGQSPAFPLVAGSDIFAEYLAWTLYVQDHVAKGIQPWRWDVLNREVQNYFREKAFDRVMAWSKDNAEMAILRSRGVADGPNIAGQPRRSEA